MEYKGIKLTLDMDTEKFNSAINRVKNLTTAWDNDIKKLKQSLKFDSGNVEQYTALVEKLRNKYNQTQESINVLKRTLDEAMEAGKIQKNSTEWVNLTNKIITLEKNLQITGRNIEEINDDWRTTGKVGKDTLNGLNRELTEHKSLWQKLGDDTNVFFGNLKANLVSNVISGGLNLIQNAITGIINGLKKLGEGYVNLLKTGIDYNSKLQDYTKSLGIILDGDEARAANVINSLKIASAQLGVDIQPLVEGTQQLTIAGVGIEDASEAILGMSKALKLVGADSGALQLVITNLMQLQTQGGATARDLREFATKGIPIYKLLAEYSERFAEGAYQAKDVKFEDVVGAILKAINDPNSAFSKSEEIIATTFSGQLQTIQVRWQQLLGDLAQDTTTAATTQILPAVNNLLQSMIDGFNEKGWEGVAEAFRNGFGEVINILFAPETIEAVLGGIEIIIDTIESAFDPETPEGQRNREVLGQAADKLVDMINNIITDITPALVEIGKVIGGAIYAGIKDELANSIKNYLKDVVLNSLTFGLGRDFDFWAGVWNKTFGSGGNGNYNSLGYGDLASGGFGMKSGGMTSNLTINVNNNGSNISVSTVRSWASIINEELGKQL